jgi:hypothetical protein
MLYTVWAFFRPEDPEGMIERYFARRLARVSSVTSPGARANPNIDVCRT